jgi:dienelactone hydrolase
MGEGDLSTTRLGYSLEGAALVGQIACPDVQGKVPGILVIPEAPGPGAHVVRRAAALAKVGYVALAADLHGEGRVLDDPKTVRPTVELLKSQPERLLGRLRAGLEALANVPQVDPARLAVIGYCFGGWCALELGRTGAALRGIAVFHGALNSALADSASKIRGKVLVCTGSADPFVPMTQVTAFCEEMSAAGVDWQVSLYGGVCHGFTSPEAGGIPAPGFGYSASADRRSWAELCSFLGELFDMEGSNGIRG